MYNSTLDVIFHVDMVLSFQQKIQYVPEDTIVVGRSLVGMRHTKKRLSSDDDVRE